MAPRPITDDYYMILKVDQTASSDQITRSYRQLAKELHPDRNRRHDATRSFQLLQEAYETLSDVSRRRAYDIIYPSLRKGPVPSTQAEASSTKPRPQAGSPSELTQIASLDKSKQERRTQWRKRENVFEWTIDELKKTIQQLEIQIKILQSYEAAAAAEEAQKNSWTTWMLSPLYKQRQVSEEERLSKERQRQERRIEKDLKERRLESKRSICKREEGLFNAAKAAMEAADSADDGKIRLLRARIKERAQKEAEAKERAEYERLAKIRKQQQEQREEEARKFAEARSAAYEKELRRQMDELNEAKRRRQQHSTTWSNVAGGRFAYQTRPSSSVCVHEGWWDKVHDRMSCPQCSNIWNYMLKCPGCSTLACPKCQNRMRPSGSPWTTKPAARDYDWYD